MEWISKFFGGNINSGTIALYYANSTGQNVMTVVFTDGVKPADLNALISHYFNNSITTAADIKGAIDNGNPLMATLNATHEVMITGYYNNGNIEYFDPQIGGYGVTNSSTLTHITTITGLK